MKKSIIDGIELFSELPRKKNGLPPILFVHGAFAGGWMWTETFMPDFARAGFRCHALSLRGHGGSEGREHLDALGINDYVDDVCRIIEHLGEPPILVGHSMGGFVVQKYLERHDAPAVILLCSVPPQGLIAAQFHLFLSKPQLFAEINNIMSGDRTDVNMLREALFAGPADEKMLTDWLSHMQSESHRAIWDMSMFNLAGIYPMHRPPMLVAGAEKDLLVPAFLVQSTAHTYRLPVTIFRDMGHAVTHEQDWPQVAASLRSWLEETLKT